MSQAETSQGSIAGPGLFLEASDIRNVLYKIDVSSPIDLLRGFVMDRFVKTLLASAAVAVLAFASGCSSQAASTDAQSAGESSAVFTSSESAQGSADAQAVDNREVAISSEQELSSEALVNEWDMVLQNCLSDTGAMMGGWWQAEGGPEHTYVNFTDDADTHWAVYSVMLTRF